MIIALTRADLVAADACSKGRKAFEAIVYVGIVPLIGLLISPWLIETRDRPLAD